MARFLQMTFSYSPKPTVGAEPIAGPLVSIVVLYLYLPDPHGAGHQHFCRVHGFKSFHSEIERSTTASWACKDVAEPHTDG